MINAFNLRATLYCVLFAGVTPSIPVSAQHVLDMPLRVGAGADALAGGPVAVFWNPGSMGLPAGRAELLVLDVRGPAPTGLDGVGIAGLYRLDDRTSLALGFQHSRIGDILQTTTSPLTEEGAVPFDLSENSFSVAVQRLAGSGTAVGASVRYTRGAGIVGGDDVLAIGAGLRHSLRPLAAFQPVLAGGAFLGQDGADWFAGVGVDRVVSADTAWIVGTEYGVRGSPRFSGVEHRMAATGSWRDRVRLSAGAVISPGAESRTVEPIGGVDLKLNRYVLGVLREQLPNALGAVHQFRFSVSF